MPTKVKTRSITGAAAAPVAASRPTHDFIGYLLVQAAMRVRAATAAALLPLQLSPQEFGLLNQVLVQPALTQAQLGSLLGIDRTTIVAMLDRLMASAWIERSADATDRRVYRISGTTKGRALHAKAVAAVMNVERQFLSRLDAGQTASLVAALARIDDPEGAADGLRAPVGRSPPTVQRRRL
jgi:DNA-binding MarR family transcriptional regulator